MLIPKENERDLVEIPKNIKQNLDIRSVRWIDEVLDVALTTQPERRDQNPPTESQVEESGPPPDTEGEEVSTEKRRGAARTRH